MKYTAKLRIHDGTPFGISKTSLHSDIEWMLFDCAVENRAWAIPLWYWHTHNTQTISVAHNTHESRTLQDGSTEQLLSVFIQEPDLDTWVDCDAYADNSQGIRDELRISSKGATLVTARDTAPTYHDSAKLLWSTNYNGNIQLVRGDTVVDLNCSEWNCEDPTHTTQYNLRDYGNATDLVRHLFLEADERRRG